MYGQYSYNDIKKEMEERNEIIICLGRLITYIADKKEGRTGSIRADMEKLFLDVRKVNYRMQRTWDAIDLEKAKQIVEYSMEENEEIEDV